MVMDVVFFQDLFSEGTYENLSNLSDGKLLTEDGWSFDVHRIILAKSNQYFRALFCGISKDRNVVLIPGISGEILNQILCYIYTGSILLNHENICELMVAADYLLVDSLMLQIQKYSEDNMSFDNCLGIYMTALKISREEIRKLGYRFIQTNFESLIWRDTVEFAEMSLDCLKQFLVDSNLRVTGEHIVWLAVVKWVLSDTPRRLCAVSELLKCLEIADIEESLANLIIHDDIVSKNPFCKELKILQLLSPSPRSLDVLRNYFTRNSSIDSVVHSHRRPGWLHLIARYHIHNLTDGVQIYITYDENVDIWRQLSETDFCPTFFSVIGYNVYMFDSYSNSNIIFNLYEKQWREMQDFRMPRVSYRLVTLKGVVYILGGECNVSGEELLNVEFYHPGIGMWFEAAPMLPVTSYNAVAFRSSIFVVGKMSDELSFGMVAQVYDEVSNVWSPFTSPGIFRFDFAFVEYHGKLYIIGGSDGSQLIKKVEVFDFETNSWNIAVDLPHTYYLPKAIVFNDLLIVFDCLLEDPKYLKKNPPVRWNETKGLWELLEKSLPLKDLALYLFFTIDDSERISTFVKENRDPRTTFEKSPFN